MKAKFHALLIISIVLGALSVVQIKEVHTQATGSIWRDDFNHANVAEMQAAGWGVSRPSGTSLSGGAVILNGVGGDAAIGIRNIFSKSVYNWTAENKNMWLGQGHSTQSITVYTERHKYVWFADGYYNQFAFYRDNAQVTRFGAYQEAANTWITLAMKMDGKTLSMYFNGQLQKTYTEPDATPAKVTGVDLISPWMGDAKYDYVWVKAANTDDLEITKLTLIQVEKDPKVLIEGKKAALAIDISSTYNNSVRAMIKLTYDFGNKVFTEVGPEGVGVRIYPGENRIYLPSGPNLPGDTEPWQNPGEGSYLYWSKSGVDNNIQVSVDPNNYLKEADRTNNDMATSKKVVDTAGIKILVVPVYFPDVPPWGPIGFQKGPQTANWFNISAVRAELAQQLRFLTETYPISEDKVLLNLAPVRAWHTKPGITINELCRTSWLRNNVALPLTKEAKLAGYDRVVILVTGLDFLQWKGTAIGMLREPENRAPVFIHYVEMDSSDYLGAYLLAHELGHTYYLWHPEDYPEEMAQSPSKCDLYDVYSRQYEKNVFTFMSASQSIQAPFWIDDVRYESNPETTVTVEYGNHVVQTKDSNLVYQFRSSPDPEVVLVSGIIFSNSTAETNDPWIRLGGIPDMQSSSVGDYSINLVDSTGRLLKKFGFNASFTGFDEVNDKFVGSTSDSIPFLFSVPYEEGVAKIELVDSNGIVMGSKVVTQNPPVVTLVSPKEGEEFASGSLVEVNWDASDADGDNLFYSVFYSADRGGSWIPLSSNQAQKTYTLNTTDLGISGDCMIKVVAADGVNVGESKSTIPFTVAASQGSVPITLTFAKVARPSDLNPNVTDTRYLSVAFDYVAVLDANKNILAKIDIGTSGARSSMGTGWSVDHQNWGDAANFAWAEGTNKTAFVYVSPFSNAKYIALKTRPLMQNNTMQVYYNDQQVATLDPGIGWNEYTLEIPQGPPIPENYPLPAIVTAMILSFAVILLLRRGNSPGKQNKHFPC